VLKRPLLEALSKTMVHAQGWDGKAPTHVIKAKCGFFYRAVGHKFVHVFRMSNVFHF
jgi:hypothetical protein